MDEPAQASPQSRGCGIQSLVFTSLPAVLGMRYSELGVHKPPRSPGDAVFGAWCFRIRDGGGTQGDGQGCPQFGIERVTLGSRGPVFFFPPSSSKLRIFLEFLKILA